MDNRPLHLCIRLASWVAHVVHRLHHGIHSSQGENRHIHDLAQGDHHSERRSIQALAPATTESITPQGRAGYLA